MTRTLNYISSDKPARAFNSRLTKGTKPEVFKGVTEGIAAAQKRKEKIPETIESTMNSIRRRVVHSATNRNQTLKLVNNVKRLIGQELPMQVLYNKELAELAKFEKQLIHQ